MLTQQELRDKYDGRNGSGPSIWYMSKCSDCIPSWFWPSEGIRHYTEDGECYKVNYKHMSLSLDELYDTEGDLVREYMAGGRK